MPENPTSLQPSSSETSLWKDTTSNWVHFWYYFVCALLAVGAIVLAMFTGPVGAVALLVPVIMVVVRWWATRCTIYELTTERFRITTGVLSRRQDELELFRVKDYQVEEPFVLRMLGLGNVTLVTADSTTPTIHIKAVRGVYAIRDQLRKAVDAARDRKRVRQMDLDNLDGGVAGDSGGDLGHHS